MALSRVHFLEGRRLLRFECVYGERRKGGNIVETLYFSWFMADKIMDFSTLKFYCVTWSYRCLRGNIKRIFRPEIAWSVGIGGRSFVPRCYVARFAPLRRPRPVAPTLRPLRRVAYKSRRSPASGIYGYPKTFSVRVTVMAAKMDASKAVKLKDEGNVLFRKGNYKEALEKYSQGIFWTPLPDF